MAKKLLIGLLGLFKKFKLWRLKMAGKTMDDVHAQRIQSGRTWDEFCDTLKAAGGNLHFGKAPTDPFSQAEGYRYLSRLVRGGLEAFVEFNDPEFPVLKRMAHETVKLGSDNPDNYYQNAQINSDYEYRITGHRGTVFYLGFFTQNGSYGKSGGLAPCGALEAEEMQFDENGRFEIILSKEKKGQNWLKIEAETTMLMVRQTFLDRSSEEIALMQIDCIGGPDSPRPLTPKYMDEGLDMASTFVAGATFLFAKWANGFKTNHPNRLPRFDQAVSDAAGGDKNIAYYHSYWNLAQDEVLVIEVMPPKCRLWNFQLNNYWMESLDYRYHQIHLNSHTAHYEPDGSVRVVVAHTDPGLPNWITTQGHAEGTMCWRWWYGETQPEPGCRVVKMVDLQKEFSLKPAN
ncbi:MAG: DUF1214 domain-containing protein [Bacteroidia bacterium]|nr:DUF1214 domain-containing protein [Bacteroidia bacterium]